MNREIELFVPGRLCLFGEHSDWAGRYRSINNEILEGHAIVTGIEQGIHAYVQAADDLIIIDEVNNKNFKIEMNLNELLEEAKSGSYYSYMCGVAAYMKENYNVGGLKIKIDEITLPIKKGLSSSAACCVLMARSFNRIYNLQLSTLGEMQVAYFGENKTPSRCGRLDQACAFGIKPVSLKFDSDDVKVDRLQVGTDFYWVFADLMSKKDTKKILADLNSCYPFAQNEISKNVQYYLGKLNSDYVLEAIEYLKKGNVNKMGELMNRVQLDFDKYVAPASPIELASPILHSVLNNEFIKKYACGGKGVGSHGDGTVQLLARDKESQEILINYLKKELKMDSYALTIKKTNDIKKAIIPIAGMGTRMFPITKIIRKNFLPIYHNDMVKPAITVLLEELYDAGMEEIYLVIDREDKNIFDKLFNQNLSAQIEQKLSSEMLEYNNKLKKIGQIVKYIYQDEKLGLGHAVYLCKKHIKNEPFLLVLGDQLYRSNNDKSCVLQTLENYSLNGKSTIAVTEVDIKSVPNYGILSGKMSSDCSFEVFNFIEKPTVEFAEQYLKTPDKKGNSKYYAVFGIYALTFNIFNILEDMVNNYSGNGEIQITSAIDKLRDDGLFAFIPDGQMFDIGTPNNYQLTWKNF